jgi:hypothetical protein
MQASDFLARIQDGDFVVILPLSDWLKENGRAAEARKLRTRYRFYLTKRRIAKANLRRTRDAALAPYKEMISQLRSLGAECSVSLKIEDGKAEHQDTLMIRYVEKLCRIAVV